MCRSSFAVVVAVVVLFGCNSVPELPWLHGVSSLELSTTVVPGRTPDDTVDPCSDAAYSFIELVDDEQRITASMAGGVQVFGPERQLVERASGEPCRGPVRQIVALGIGTVARTKTIVVVDEAREGSRTSTTATVFRSGRLDQLDRVFSGVVELRDASGTRTGELAFVGDRLLHVAPDAAPVLHAYDARTRTYRP